MKKVLLHIDPCDLRTEMLVSRAQVFLQLAFILRKSGFRVQCFGPKGVIQSFVDIIGKENVTESDYVYRGKDSYHALAWSNSLMDCDFGGLIWEYRKMEEDFDIIVTNTPSALLRRVWPSCLILHFELGFFNRNPFPLCYQFDPLGFYHKSLLAKYPDIYSKKGWLRHEFLSSYISQLSYRACAQSGIDKKKIGKLASVYIPLPSDTWASKIEHDFPNRVAYLRAMAMMLSDKQIITNEKPQYPLSQEECNDLARIQNLQIVKNHDRMGAGSILAASCAATLTYSPSLSLQCLFWGNQFIPLSTCSMSSWGRLDNAQDVLASYIFNFQVFDLTEFVFKSEIWKSVYQSL